MDLKIMPYFIAEYVPNTKSLFRLNMYGPISMVSGIFASDGPFLRKMLIRVCLIIAIHLDQKKIDQESGDVECNEVY